MKRIIEWIKAQVRQAHARGIVVGISGGVDSASVACLSAKAVGAKNALGLIMPCYSQAQDIKDARSFARQLKIKTVTVNLKPVYDAFLKILPPDNKKAAANLKARLRMATLYYFANKFNYLVCGTGNKSELNVGYFTKYGDGGVDILPIGGLYKTQVWKLAKELALPRQIVEKTPTAGLWPGQTDEGEMGITYCELDGILTRLEKGKPQVAAKNRVAKVKRMLKESGHKRSIAAVCKI